ncbi:MULTISPECIES: type II secretion system protein [unclassified Massilia]|uniref:type II secretion system protein n=1 Tax=unclassified Massilia TaxID=2609279 RepID=UPI0027D7AD01|nr:MULTISPECIES: prepilin-type N-terminal cleavage/methylation domain-containing protein [unclassified Massilia]
MKPSRGRAYGFTLVELLVVLSIIALLLTIGIPRYFHSLDLSREQVLRANLASLRHVLDKYYEDRGVYPESLDTLVSGHYLRAVPVDPLTGKSDTWVVVPPDTPEKGGVADLHSGAVGKALDGSAYGDW